MSDNDFTLEELQLIQDNLSWNECLGVNAKLIALDHKLTDMIANYCDHDFQNTYNEREVWRCKLCGVE